MDQNNLFLTLLSAIKKKPDVKETVLNAQEVISVLKKDTSEEEKQKMLMELALQKAKRKQREAKKVKAESDLKDAQVNEFLRSTSNVGWGFSKNQKNSILSGTADGKEIFTIKKSIFTYEMKVNTEMMLPVVAKKSYISTSLNTLKQIAEKFSKEKITSFRTPRS